MSLWIPNLLGKVKESMKHRFFNTLEEKPKILTSLFGNFMNTYERDNLLTFYNWIYIYAHQPRFEMADEYFQVLLFRLRKSRLLKVSEDLESAKYIILTE